MGGRGNPPKRTSDQTALKMQAGDKKQCHRCRNECGKDFMKCNLCDSIFHTKCENISTQQLSLFRELDKLKTPYEWLCSTCRKTDVMNIMKSIQAMQTKIDNLEKEVVSLKQKNNSVNSDQSAEPTSSQTNPSSHSHISEAVNEALDIERRKLNLVVSGIPQSSEKSDAKLVHELIEDPALGITGTVFVRDVQRIGNMGRILITFDSIEHKRVVLQGAYHLRTSDIPGHRNIYISPDLTKKQRQIEFELRTELRLRRKNGEVGLKISKGKIVNTGTQEPQNVPPPQANVNRVHSKSPGTAPVNGNRASDKSRRSQQSVPQSADGNQSRDNAGTPHRSSPQVPMVRVVRSSIPRPSPGSSGCGGSAASAEVAGSQTKN